MEELDEFTREDKREFSQRMQSYEFSPYDFRNERMDADVSTIIGESLADYYGNSGTVIVGRDYREESGAVKDGVITGLYEEGCDVRQVGPAPTDMVSFFIDLFGAEGGVSVTASHVPPGYRGLKPLNYQGRILDAEEMEEVFTDEVQEFIDNHDFPADIGESYLYLGDRDKDNFGVYRELYIEELGRRHDGLFDEFLTGLEVVVDPGNGVGGLTLPPLLEYLGVEEDDLYLINYELDPEFSGRGPDPTAEGALEPLKKEVVSRDADLGMALDGDADRVVFVNERGEKVSGDESLAILSEKYLSAESPEDGSGEIAMSANTSQLVEDCIVEKGGKRTYHPVGAVFPAKRALENERVILGGQPNGHFLDPYIPYDSGTLFGAVMAGIVKEKDESMSQIQDGLPAYDISKKDFPSEEKHRAVGVFRDMTGLEISDTDFEGIYRTKIAEDTIGDFETFDNLIFRAAGTEDAIRLILEKEKSSETLKGIVGALERKMERKSK